MKRVVILVVLCSVMFLFSGCSLKKTAELSDAEKFANEYSISKNNPFQYASVDDVLNLLDHESGILFVGNSDCEWSAYGAKVLNKVVKEEKVDKVYYFNPENKNHKRDKKYKEVNKLLDITDDTSLPIVYVIHNGKILDYVDYLVHEDSTINQDTTEQLENKYLNLISQYM